jgi:hypothetical protein
MFVNVRGVVLTMIETFKKTRRVRNKITCIWAVDGQMVVEGYGNNKTEARESAEEVAKRFGILNRPTKQGDQR